MSKKQILIAVVLIILASLSLGIVLGLRLSVQIFEIPIPASINEILFPGLAVLAVCLGLFYRSLR
jgi:hypothetical protein